MVEGSWENAIEFHYPLPTCRPHHLCVSKAPLSKAVKASPPDVLQTFFDKLAARRRTNAYLLDSSPQWGARRSAGLYLGRWRWQWMGQKDDMWSLLLHGNSRFMRFTLPHDLSEALEPRSDRQAKKSDQDVAAASYISTIDWSNDARKYSYDVSLKVISRVRVRSTSRSAIA